MAMSAGSAHPLAHVRPGQAHLLAPDGAAGDRLRRLSLRAHGSGRSAPLNAESTVMTRQAAKNLPVAHLSAHAIAAARPTGASHSRPCRRGTKFGAACVLAIGAGLATGADAQAEPVAAPAFGGPLRANPTPYTIDVGGFGKLSITGQLTGLGITQSHAIPYSGPQNRRPLLDVSNAQIEVQTTGSPLQFYVQAGAYALPSLGTAYMRATDALKQLYGPVPVAYGKVQITPEFSIQAGLLPTLVGAESTFSFQNMNISRGLL